MLTTDDLELIEKIDEGHYKTVHKAMAAIDESRLPRRYEVFDEHHRTYAIVKDMIERV